MTCVAAFWWWNHVADRRIADLIAAAHARGEPILPEDFDAPPVPDSQNAALTLQQASAAMVITPQFSAFEDSYSGGKLSGKDATTVAAIKAANQKALSWFLQANSRRQVDWNIKVRPPVFTFILSHLNSQRQLAMLAKCSALYEHSKSNDGQAMEYSQALLGQARTIDQSAPFLISHLVAIGIEMTATSAIDQIAPELAVDAAGPARPSSGCASRDQVAALIDDLLNDGPRSAAAERSWYGERMAQLDGVRHPGLGGFGVPDFPLLYPMFKLDGVRMAARTAQVATAMSRPNLPEARDHLPPQLANSVPALEEVSQVMSRVLEPSFRRHLEQHYRAATERHAAAILLAIRMYRLDHGGAYPPSLEALVPAYLPQVPIDAMAAGGRPMRYCPERKPPVIYSVGSNGTDDGGTSLPGPGIDRWQMADAVWELEPSPSERRALTPPTSPSTQTEDHH